MTEIGTLIDNKYRILELIGQGGMSYIYLAMDERLDKQWAIKEIKRVGEKLDEVIVNSILRETNLLKKLDHPMLPRIVDIIKNESSLYIVMDYIDGQTLDSVLNQQGAQLEADVVLWAKQLCDALNYLHSQNPPIIYRDMKPANIMLKSNGNIKLIDFGIAREYKSGKIGDTTALGTIGYAAPEQFAGQTEPRTDIYNLGVTLYHLLTGVSPCEPPYMLYPVRSIKPELSEGIERIIQKCTEPDIQNRYRNCRELLYDLEHYAFLSNQDKKEGFIQIIKAFFKKRKRENVNSHKITGRNDISNARYMARSIIEMNRDNTDMLNVKGPNYDEWDFGT